MKIDTSLIEGFEEMSAEEQLEALKSYEFEDVEALKKDKANYKKRIDELTAELSKKKKEGSKNLSEAEQALEDLKAEKAELQEKYDELVKASSIASNKSKYLKLGFDEALAEDTATALADGDMEKVFANLEKHQASFEKKLKADAMRGATPSDKGAPTKAMSREEILKIKDPVERQNAIAEHMDLFTGKE